MEIKINSDYFYCLHDDDINSFTMRIVEPKIVTATFHVNNDFAYLLDVNTNQILGFQFFNFFSNWLYKDRQMYEIWMDYNYKKYFSEWQQEDFKYSTIIVYLKREMFKSLGLILSKEN